MEGYRTLKSLHSVPPLLFGLCATQKTVARANVYNKHGVQKNGVNKGQPRAWINPFVALRFPFPDSREVGGEKQRETPPLSPSFQGGSWRWGWRTEKTKTETPPLRALSRFSALFVADRKSLRRESRRAPPMAIFRILCRRFCFRFLTLKRRASFLSATDGVHLSVASLIENKSAGRNFLTTNISDIHHYAILAPWWRACSSKSRCRQAENSPARIRRSLSLIVCCADPDKQSPSSSRWIFPKEEHVLPACPISGLRRHFRRSRVTGRSRREPENTRRNDFSFSLFNISVCTKIYLVKKYYYMITILCGKNVKQDDDINKCIIINIAITHIDIYVIKYSILRICTSYIYH